MNKPVKTMPVPVPAIPPTMGIELIELETFIAVAQAESFSAAALRLHVTQPTVTGRIQRLESALGAKLLHRTTRKVEATAEGARLLTESLKALEDLRKLVQGFKAQDRLARQRVVVAATPTLAALTLPVIIQAYAERFPDVEVVLLDASYAGVLAALDEGRADLGVMAFEGKNSHYRFQPLWSDDMVLIAPLGHPLAGMHSVGPEVLATHVLMVLDQYQGIRARIAETLHQRGLSLPPSKVVANLSTLLGMLNAGMGLTLFPRSMSMRREVARHALVEIEKVDLSRQFGIVLAKRATLNTAGQSFCRFFRQATPALLAKSIPQ